MYLPIEAPAGCPRAGLRSPGDRGPTPRRQQRAPLHGSNRSPPRRIRWLTPWLF